MKILVVDDEETNTLILQKMLKNNGHEISIAENGKQAIVEFEKVQPDLILMDVMMPVMDGYEATKIIKAKTQGTFVPVIFVTAMNADDALISCLKNGGDDYVAKPFNKEVLFAKLSAIERTLTLHRTIQNQYKQLQSYQDQLLHERVIAEQIFTNLVRKKDLNQKSVNCYHHAADTFNGDVLMAVNSPRGGMNYLLGDITGHGLVAALCTLPVVEIFHMMSLKGYCIKDIIYEVNKKISQMLPKGKFFAASLIHVNSVEKYVEVLNAGMPDVLLFNENIGIKHKFSSENLPLGILPSDQVEVTTRCCKLVQDDRLFLYSDGLIEAETETGSVGYDQENLEKCISSNMHSKKLIEVIESDLLKHCGHNEFHDDVSMMEINCNDILAPEKLLDQKALTSSGNWNFSIKLDHNSLKENSTIPLIYSMLMELNGRSMKGDNIFRLISEMFENALIHGILKLNVKNKQSADGFVSYCQDKTEKLQNLDSGYIQFSFSFEKLHDRLTLSVADSGEGFDYKSALETLSGEESGLGFIKSVCKEVRFNESGNEITAIFDC